MGSCRALEGPLTRPRLERMHLIWPIEFRAEFRVSLTAPRLQERRNGVPLNAVDATFFEIVPVPFGVVVLAIRPVRVDVPVCTLEVGFVYWNGDNFEK